MKPTVAAAVRCYEAGAFCDKEDELAAEEPLEIRVEGKSIAVVMRTPGEDRELAAGFALSEGLIQSPREIFDITACPAAGGAAAGNAVDILLTNPAAFDPQKFTRHLFTSSSCGICSKTTIDAVRRQFPPIQDDSRIARTLLLELPHRLAASQETFRRTGGLHASALFDLEGQLIALREDVGRHNALDKLIGHALLCNLLPLRERVVLLSGRISFEMMQKALAAGIPIVAAISAPSSLAVEFARESGQTLIGFLRGESMNVYAAPERVISS